jgi:hypothetical protein
MTSETTLHDNNILDIRAFKEMLRKKLPPGSLLILDLLREPDSLPLETAGILIPHYLRRLERELESYEATGPLVRRS